MVSAYGGDYLTSLLRSKLSSQKINITPNCFLKKQVVEGVVANIQKIEYPNTRVSFLNYAINVENWIWRLDDIVEYCQ